MQFGAVIGFARVPLYSKLVVNFCPLPSFSFMLNVNYYVKRRDFNDSKKVFRDSCSTAHKKKRIQTINRGVGSLKQLSGRDVNAHTVDIWG